MGRAYVKADQGESEEDLAVGD